MAEITTRRMEANGLSFEVDEAGSGDSVALCLHGFPESRFSWRHQLPVLADLGWRAIAPDTRGYGQSSRPPKVADYKIDRLVDDAAGLFEAAGAKRRLLIGHDWGGIIAWAFAAQNRLPLDGLIVMNAPHPVVFGKVMRSSWKQRMKSWYMFVFQIPGLPEALTTANNARAVVEGFTREAVDKSAFPPEVTEVYRRNALIPGAMTAMINYYRANVLDLSRFRGDLPKIEAPTLLIWGENDGFMGVEATEGYGPYVRDFTLRRLPNVSHWVQQEAPVAVNAAMAAWMKDKGLA
ncbi:MAG TPA: alpha/beta hydrolase [Caulobacteraceae bacterium]|nr:alpha/beta hydrolase [Caulobacteraceae bacterium]